MSELAVGSLAGLAANSYVIDVASGSQLTQPGMILQVVHNTYSTETTVTSTSFTDTGLTATITPTSASSKILIVMSQNMRMNRSTSEHSANLQILRDSTVIEDFGDPEAFVFLRATGSSAVGLRHYENVTIEDSPATTSAITYKTQIRVTTTANSALVEAQVNNQPSFMTLLEVAA